MSRITTSLRRPGSPINTWVQAFSLTVYVYDAGIADIPDGGDYRFRRVTCSKEAKQEIGAAGYTDVRLISEQLVRLAPPADVPLARESGI